VLATDFDRTLVWEDGRLHERTIAATSRSNVALSITGAVPPERPMMKCTRTSGPSGKNG
jgi:hypothetical protein